MVRSLAAGEGRPSMVWVCHTSHISVSSACLCITIAAAQIVGNEHVAAHRTRYSSPRVLCNVPPEDLTPTRTERMHKQVFRPLQNPRFAICFWSTSQPGTSQPGLVKEACEPY